MSSPHDSETERPTHAKALARVLRAIIDKSTKPAQTANAGPILLLRRESGHLHWYLSDPRLSDFEIGYREVYSVRRKQFPLFGRVESVRWLVGGPYMLEPREGYFYECVADCLNQDILVTEAIMMADADVEITVYPDGYWVICNLGLTTITQDCLQAIAEALLGLPIPTNE